MNRRTSQALCPSTLTAATLLAACGGSDDSANASTGGGTVALAAFVVSTANPSSYNGPYSKTTVQAEHGSSNAALTTYNASDDHCRVGFTNVALTHGSTTVPLNGSRRSATAWRRGKAQARSTSLQPCFRKPWH